MSHAFLNGFDSRSMSVLHAEYFMDMDEFFDPRYDSDFPDMSTSSTFMRGDEIYNRPRGWFRMALKVRDRYRDGNTWLGPVGLRSQSMPGEWPVSYHGTSIGGAIEIIRDHYKAGDGAINGRGIYSTSQLHVAEEKATCFTSKKTGHTYKVIMQNRINPKERKICSNKFNWLILVPEGTVAEEEKKIVERSIRPYGILIKQV